MCESKSCDWVHKLADRWVSRARDRGRRALEMYDTGLKIDNDHERVLRYIANAFYFEGILAELKEQLHNGRDRRTGEKTSRSSSNRPL